jgi:glycosyltransferase involved in cell wall biosynthesis
VDELIFLDQLKFSLQKVLYITYDGLTDPLGQSQVLPYIIGLQEHGYQFVILSFEKEERFKKYSGNIYELLKGKNIRWVPLKFTSKPPLLSKFYDAIKMKVQAVKLHKTEEFDMVHCRSYIAADTGLMLKKRFGVKFFFDMRGFWADEKKDGGSWNMNNPVFRRVYSYYKKKEAQYLQNADYIISLTEAGKKEMCQWPSYNKNIPLMVIPCCADMDLFSSTDNHQKEASKKRLGVSSNQLVISYLGSVGTWYMLDEMLLLFMEIKKIYPASLFLFVTHTPPGIIDARISSLGLEKKDFIIVSASRKEVPIVIKASDINISFIKPVYSKLSSSPTKLGEVLSMGIPVICNSGVGDVEAIVKMSGGGYIIKSFTETDLKEAVKSIPELLAKDPQMIRNNIKDIYSLTNGVQRYFEAYSAIFNKSLSRVNAN